MRRIAQLLFKTLGLLILAGSLVAGWMLMDWKSALRTPLTLGVEGLRYTIPKGAPLKEITADLARLGVLKHPRYLEWEARWTGEADRIQAGEYLIPAGTTPVQMLELFLSGKVVQHKFTLVEGWTFHRVMAALEHDDAVKPTLKGISDEEIMTRLGSPGVHPEGWFLPETYSFPRGTADLEILRHAYRDMRALLDKEWQARADGLPLSTPAEALTLASIIEKETGQPQERSRIAGVFVRRLSQGMRLQTDPTVIYGMGDAFDGNIRRQDLQRDTPYNTYVHTGLPPTPIAMPGAGAIHAALHPEPGKELYFVAKGDGTHQFSVSLDEHRRAVLKYQIKASGKRTATTGRAAAGPVERAGAANGG